jgi:hypothetical protein
MDIKKLKDNASIIIPASAALLSILYLSRREKAEEKKGLKEVPFPPNATNLPIFGKYNKLFTFLFLKFLFIHFIFLGHIFALGSCPSKQVTKWHDEIGPIYKIYMGNQLWIMISDPFLAHDIFVKAGSSTSSRPYHRFLIDIYGKNNR